MLVVLLIYKYCSLLNQVICNNYTFWTIFSLPRGNNCLLSVTFLQILTKCSTKLENSFKYYFHVAKSDGNVIFLIHPQLPLRAPSLLPALKWLLEALYNHVLGKAPSSRCHPLFLCFFLLVCISSSLRKGVRRLIILRPSIVENGVILLSRLINSLAGHGILDWTSSPDTPLAPWEQLLYCFQVSSVALEKSGAILLPDPSNGTSLLSLWKVSGSSLCPTAWTFPREMPWCVVLLPPPPILLGAQRAFSI